MRELLFEVGQVGSCEFEIVQEGKTLGKSSKYCKFSFERVLSNEKVKGGIFLGSSRLDICQCISFWNFCLPSNRHRPYESGKGR